jgi:Predicted periplasmic/secreted protein
MIAEENNHEGEILKGLIAGLVGGIVASAVMNGFQQLFSKYVTGEERSHGAQSLQTGTPQHGIGRKLREQGIEDPKDDAAERLANAIAFEGFDYKLTEDEKSHMGTVFHYGYGASTAAFYGAVAEIIPAVTAGAGMPYGAAIWLGADEGVVPLLGLSKTSSEYPISIHAFALASHLVYGLTTEVVRRNIRAIL